MLTARPEAEHGVMGGVARPCSASTSRRSRRLIANSTDSTAALSTQGSLALAYTLSGDQAAGRALAKETLNELRAITRPVGHATLEGLSDVAEVMIDALARDPSADALADARKIVGLLRRQAAVFPIATPSFRYWQARLRALEGRSPSGALRRGLVSADELGMPAEGRRLAEAQAQGLARR